MKVLFPQPDSPTKAQDSDGLIFKVRPLRTKSSFLVGYLNQTSSNSISPLIFERSSLTFSTSLSSAQASIVDSCYKTPKTLLTEAVARPISGAEEADEPATIAPNIRIIMADITLAGLILPGK